MGIATLVLVASLMATSTLADVGSDSRLSSVELAIIKSIVDAVPGSRISAGNPYNWASLQTRSRALQGADIQVLQVQDRSPDSFGRSGHYPDDANIIQTVSTQLGNLEGPPSQPHGLNIKKSVSAELHLNAQVLPDLPAKEPSLKQVSYNYQEPAFNSPPISAQSGAHRSLGGGESFSIHRSFASELNAAMFGDFPPQQPAPPSQQFFQQQAPVFNNYPQSFSQFQTQKQHSYQQQLPNFNNQQQSSSVSGGGYNDFNNRQQYSSVSGSQVSRGGYNDFNNQQQYSSVSGAQVSGGRYNGFNNQQQHSTVSGSQLSGGGYNNFNNHQQYSSVSGGGNNDFSIQKSVPYDFPSDTVVPPRPPLAQGRVDVGHLNQFTQFGNNRDVSGTHKPAGGLSEFSIQKSVETQISSDSFKMPGEHQEPLQYPIDIRLSGDKNTFSSSSGTQNSGKSNGYSNQQSISNDIPTELFAPPAQNYNQWNQNQGSRGVNEVSVQKSIASEMSASGAQRSYSHSERFVESGIVKHGQAQGGVNEVSVQKSIASEIPAGGLQRDYSHSEGFDQSGIVKHGQGQMSLAKQVNQVAYDAALNSGQDINHQEIYDGPVQEKADFVEVNIMRTVSSSDEETSSGSHEVSSESNEGGSSVENSEEYNTVHVEDTSGEHHSSESGSSEEVDVHAPEREETPPLEDELPCKEGERKIKNVCRKVYSLQLKAHLRKK